MNVSLLHVISMVLIIPIYQYKLGVENSFTTVYEAVPLSTINTYFRKLYSVGNYSKAAIKALHHRRLTYFILVL